MTFKNGLRIVLFLYLFILLFSHSPAYADTTVGGAITSNTTWTLANSPYLVTSTVQVYGTTTTPVTLTIQPGVVVKFNAGTGIYIGNGANQGSLISRGTTTNHITFTRSGTSGTWAGITFYDGTVDSTTAIEYADIQYSAGIVMASASPSIRNSTITNVTGYGLSLSSSNPTIDTVTITNTGAYGIYLASSNPALTNVAITTNSSYGIYLGSSSPVITGGSLTNTSATGHGIYGNGSPVISNYSVSTINTAGYYGLYFNSTTTSLSITNSTIGNGLYLGPTGITPTITGNTFTNADNSPIHAGANIIANILNNNTVNGMTSVGKIEVVGEQIKQNAQWKKWTAPYIVLGTIYVYKDTTTASTLTIDPGVTIKFASSAGLYIGYNTYQGSLVAKGTSTSRITFTRSGTSGTWYGVAFHDGTVDSTTAIEYADIQYSTGVAMYSASPAIKNSTITDVTGYGLNLSYSNPTLNTVTITNNGSYGIYLSSSSPTITGGSLTNTNTTGHGIYGAGSPIISNYNISIVNAANYYGAYLSSTTSTLSITNSTIANGLYLASTNIIPTITGNTFTNVDNAPIHAGANIIANILNNNTVNGMTSAGRIEIVGEQVKQDAQWKKWNAPYVVVSGYVSVYKDTTSPATLTIDPGVIVKFAIGAGLQIGYNTSQGALVARGTSSNRITFTRSGTSGTWYGMTFNNGTIDSATAIEYADIQYSNGITMYSASPAIRNSTITDVNGYLNLSTSNPILENVTINIANTSSGTYGIFINNNSNPTITNGSLTNLYPTGQGIYGQGSPVISNYNVSIVNSAAKYGIYLSSTTAALTITNSTIANGLYLSPIGSTMPTITGNTFTNADNSPIHAGANIIARIMSNNTVNGMTSAGKIEVVGEAVTQDAQWKKWNAPYVVVSGWVSVYKDTTTASTLTIDPGTTIKFGSGTGLQVGYSTSKGVLIAQGTSANRILFTSSQAIPTAGYWSGINFSGDAASASRLEYATIEYAGLGTGYSNANLILSASSPSIKNCIIRNSAGSGVYMAGALGWPMIMNSEITGNKWGVYSMNSNPAITNTKIYSNSTYGVYNASTTMDVDARDNYWGASTGPTHTSNPKGTGDKISNKVIYNPWLSQAPGTTLSITEAKVLPASVNPLGDYVTFTAKISTSATWTITITDGSNATIKTLNGSGTSISQKWYGDNSLSVKVADGVYYYKIEAFDSVSNSTASAPQGMIMVSRLIPIAILNPPADNQMFQGGATINITGTAADSTDFKNYSLDYGTGENPATWTNLKTSTIAVTNSLIYAWNTSTLTGGVYTVKLTVTDTAGNIATETARVRFLWIQNAAASDAYISPNGDGIKDTTTISASVTYPANWTITIKNSSAAVVKTYTGTGTSLSQPWDGKNSAGAVVPDGSYTYQIDAISPETSVATVPKTGTIIVDITKPLAQITAPASGAVIRDSVSVLGTASDSNLDNYKVEYGPASGAGPWNLISSATTSISGGTLTTWVTNDQTNVVLVSNGSYALRLTATDKAGNSTISSIPVSISNLILSNISASSHTLNTYLNETSKISYAINSAATVTLKIIPEKQGPTGTPVYQTSRAIASAGSYSFIWNGKDNTNKVVPDEAYLYVLAASDGTKSDSYSPPSPTGTGTVTWTQSTGFDPVKNLPMTVTYTPTQPSRVKINISWGVLRYTVLDAFPATTGSHSFDWDGRNPSNKLLDTGVYSSCSIASLLRENYVITTGDTVKVVNLKTDPYAMHLAYGHFTRITYTLLRDANVTVKLTSPSGAVITLINNQLQSAGSHEIDWNGMDAAETTGKKTLVTQEGDYMVSVQTVNTATGTSSITRANLRIGY